MLFRVAALVLGLLTAPSLALGSTYDAQLFYPTPGKNGILTTETGDVNKHLELNLNLQLNYAYKPVAVYRVHPKTQEELGEVIGDRLDLNLYGAIGLFDWADIGLIVPIVFQDGSGITEVDGEEIDYNETYATIGDITLVPKLRLIHFDDGLFSLAVIPKLIIPTGDEYSFAGEQVFVFAPSIAASTKIGRLKVAGQLGYILRERVEVLNLVFDDEISYNLAASWNFATEERPIELMADLHGRTPADNPWNSMDAVLSPNSPLELDVGVRFKPLDFAEFHVGVGTGLVPGYNAPVFRAFTGVGFSIDTVDEAPLDSDGDGFTDDKDACPYHPEDFDGFEDEDGCPEDNDKDGVPDVIDQCPNTPEDEIDMVDETGCTLVKLTPEKIEISEKVQFEFDSDVLRDTSFGLLNKIVLLLEKNPDINVRIEGHTDSVGEKEYNQMLSEKRAQAVMNFLVVHGIDEERLEAVGYGEDKPISSNKTKRGRDANRRVEFLVLTIE